MELTFSGKGTMRRGGFSAGPSSYNIILTSVPGKLAEITNEPLLSLGNQCALSCLPAAESPGKRPPPRPSSLNLFPVIICCGLKIE
jgi:hypothetical protein